MKRGTYLHFKGNHYEVLGVAIHSETEEQLVIYRPVASVDHGVVAQSASEGWFVRPYDMFNERVDVDGESVPRFRFVQDSEEPLQ